MAEILDWISEVVQDIIEVMSYPGITFVMFLENIFPPIPSEVVMPFAGFLVADGKMNMVGIIVAGTLGAVLGAIAIYYIGVWADEPLIRAFIRRYGRFFMLDEADIDRALEFFDRYGEIIIFTGRLIPLIRSLISLPAGMKRMPMGKFLLFTTLGSSIWTTILSVAGYTLGKNWEDVLGIVDQYEHVTLALLALGVVVFFGKRFWDRRRDSRLATVPGGAPDGAPGSADQNMAE
ncbi:MAG: DedA family protein [Chloroflexi bacterium]|nr:DedA family protein [Chloroflexota bacterium]